MTAYTSHSGYLHGHKISNISHVSGEKVPKTRWKIISSVVDAGLGDLLGKLYVEKYFTAEAKKRMLDMVNNLQSVFRQRLQQLAWMSVTTKAKALDKLNAFNKKIGYPDVWKTHDDIAIDKNTYFGKHQAIEKT